MMKEPIILALIADASSIIGVGMTIFVSNQVGALKRRVIRDARIPQAFEDMERFAEKLRENLKDFPDHEKEAMGTVQRIDGLLTNMIPKLAGSERKKVAEPQRLIKKQNGFLAKLQSRETSVRQSHLWDVYYAVLGAAEVLKQMDNDHQKRV